MNTVQINTRPRTMASVCRRRDRLQVEGIRPATLAWAVAEVSESAIAISELPGPEMVRTCLEQALDPNRSGSECEALLVLSAGGVGRVRRELRSVGVSVPLTRNEAFREVRRARCGVSPSYKKAFEAIRTAGAVRVMEMALDHSTSFVEALAAEIVTASQSGEKERVQALTDVGGRGIGDLHRGVKVDVVAEVRAAGVTAIAGIVAGQSPRRVLRARARAAEGQMAETLAALSFVQIGSLKRAVRIVTGRSRKQALREMGRARRAGEIDSKAIYRAVGTVGAVWLMELMDDDGVPFDRALASEVVVAFDGGEPERAHALIDIGAFGNWRLHRGVKVDVSDEVREQGAAEIAEIVAGESPQRVLRDRARAAEGQEAAVLAALSFVEPRRLERSVTKALHQRVAPALCAAVE